MPKMRMIGGVNYTRRQARRINRKTNKLRKKLKRAAPGLLRGL